MSLPETKWQARAESEPPSRNALERLIEWTDEHLSAAMRRIESRTVYGNCDVRHNEAPLSDSLIEFDATLMLNGLEGVGREAVYALAVRLEEIAEKLRQSAE